MNYFLDAPPPPIVHNQLRINSHSRLSEIVKSFEAPPSAKETPQTKTGIKPWEKKMRLDHHIMRMRTFTESAASPNLSLREIQTGKKDRTTERVILALYTYFVGIAFVLFMLKN
jgi:hypothetical protein